MWCIGMRSLKGGNRKCEFQAHFIFLPNSKLKHTAWGGRAWQTQWGVMDEKLAGKEQT